MPIPPGHAAQRKGASAHTVFPLDVPQELRHAPLQDDHLDGRDTFSSQTSIDSLEHLLFLVRGDEDPSFPVRVRLRKLPGLVFGYELVPLAKHTLATRVYLRRIGPIVPGCGLQLFGPLGPSHLSEYSWRLDDLGTTNDAQRKPASFWNHRKQEEREILGHRGLPPASA